mgnify:CR=1 FL=1
MFKVYKYEIKSGEYQDLLMPKGAKILTVQVQGRSVCIWALVNPDNELESRRFLIAGTGHAIEGSVDNLLYIGTFQITWEIFPLVFHVFEVITR